jgi:hypothetical protein
MVTVHIYAGRSFTYVVVSCVFCSVMRYLSQYPGFDLDCIGHSMVRSTAVTCKTCQLQNSKRWTALAAAAAVARALTSCRACCVQGAGVGALLALRLNTEERFKQDLGKAQVTCIGVASAACLTG